MDIPLLYNSFIEEKNVTPFFPYIFLRENFTCLKSYFITVKVFGELFSFCAHPESY